MATGEIQQINKKLDELINFLVSQFDRVEKRLTSLENGQEKILSRVTSLEKGQQQILTRVMSLENGQEKTISRLTGLENGQDHILGELKTLNEDKEVGAYRSRRMESWIVRASKKIDLPYNR